MFFLAHHLFLKYFITLQNPISTLGKNTFGLDELIIFAIVGTTIISLKFKKVSNRSKRIWELRNYKEPADKKIAEDVVAEEESLGEEEDGTTIGDTLAAMLSDSEKCKS